VIVRLAPVLQIALLLVLRGAVAAELSLPGGADLTQAIVADLVRADLAARGIAGDLAVEVRQPAAAVPNRAEGETRVALVGLRYDRRSGRFHGRLQAALATGESATIPITGRVDELIEVAVPTRPIARGEMIAAADVGLALLPVASLAEDAVRHVEDLVGRQAARPLAAGRAARAGEVTAPWQVRRGESASMAFARGGLQIVTAAEALENGRAGQTIRVRNATSGEVRQAVVIGPRRVEVLGLAP
jgi:flagella basal body P-ring formation protein FlgA